MKEEKCFDCEYRSTPTTYVWQSTNYVTNKDRMYCDLSHQFTADIKKCAKEMTVKQIRNNCSCYIPAKDMGDGRSCCTAHLADARAFPCWIKSVEDLLKDPDFEFGRCILRSKSKKNV